MDCCIKIYIKDYLIFWCLNVNIFLFMLYFVYSFKNINKCFIFLKLYVKYNINKSIFVFEY